MDAATAALVVGGVLVAAAVVGVVLQVTRGRARAATGAVDAAEIGVGRLGERATLVQFSTELCAHCPGTRRLLGGIAGARVGVAHVDVDLTHRPDLARRFGVLQTPTTLVVGPAGDIRSRFGGVPRRDDVERELDLIGA